LSVVIEFDSCRPRSRRPDESSSLARIGLIILALLPGGRTGAAPQEPPRYELVPLVVTAGRIPVPVLALTRAVTVLDREALRELPGESVAELLSGVLGLDVRERGPGGVQADLRIRGGSFEGVLVLVDGVRVNDPQTGHHDLDLPITREDIERIEVLKGPASGAWGPDAFDGVVQIITRRGGASGIRVEVVGGEHRQARGGISLSLGRSGLRQRFSLQRSSTGGYRYNTDARSTTLAWSGEMGEAARGLRLNVGWTEKAFGANGFYTSAYPSQWERVRTGLVSVTGYLAGGTFRLEPRAWWRRGWDTFLLDRTDPAFYRNDHTSDSWGVGTQLARTGPGGVTLVGFEVGGEEVRSTNLGDHDRFRSGLYAEHRLAASGRLQGGLGLNAWHYPDRAWEVWPGIDAGIGLGRGVVLTGSYGRSFRMPSFTELYYHDPANLGNADLRPERAWTVETGLRWRRPGAGLELTLFHRRARDLIDWVREEETEPWSVLNISSVRVRGLEVSAEIYPVLLGLGLPLDRLTLGWTRLELDRAGQVPVLSKYVFDHLEEQEVLTAAHRLPAGLRAGWSLRRERRAGSTAHLLADLKLTRSLGRFALFLEADNLFNVRWEDFGLLPMPGRWLRFGLRLGLESGIEGGAQAEGGQPVGGGQ
jgi:vitamin B12 transporter